MSISKIFSETMSCLLMNLEKTNSQFLGNLPGRFVFIVFYGKTIILEITKSMYMLKTNLCNIMIQFYTKQRSDCLT